jgi:hypothetical protein
MNKIVLSIKGKEYPCKLALGAISEFQDIEGRMPKAGNLRDSIKLFYFGVKVQSLRENKKFNMTLSQFEDWIDDNPEQFLKLKQLQETSSPDHSDAKNAGSQPA